MLNKVMLIGRLGNDPEIRHTQSGNAVGNLSLATDRRVKDKNGNWNSETEWHRVVCFGKTAENVERYCKKGKQVYIEGRLQTRKWQDKEGRDRWSTEVVANLINFLGSKSDDSGGGGSTSSKSSSGSTMGNSYVPPGQENNNAQDDDIPF